MRHIVLTPELAELQDVEVKKPKETTSEKWTAFYYQTITVINVGVARNQIRYTDAGHYRRVRKALKALEAAKAEADVFIEDIHYDLLFGTEERPGVIMQYGGWHAGDFTDAYLEAWELAKVVSVKEMQAAMKKKRKDEAGSESTE